MKTAHNHAPDPALVFIFPKDVSKVLIHITTYVGALKHYNKIKDSLGKQKHQRLTVAEFAEWEGLSPQLIVQKLVS